MGVSDRGQGLNRCIGDVVSIFEALKKGKDGTSLQDAVYSYDDDDVVDRGSKECKVSHDAALVMHDWNQFLLKSPLINRRIGEKS